jgi:putative phosphoserine phosphatase/1-acylglycerol-3-phosphate O-acyltransferase
VPRERVQATIDEIRNGPAGPEIGAFFDFDGTLIEGYSAVALFQHRLKNFEIGPDEAVRTVRAALRGTSSLTEEQFVELVEAGIKGWAGRHEDDLSELGQRLFVKAIAKALFHDAWALVKAHQRRGHTVAIASSATRFQIEPMAHELGVQHILCTPLEVENGIVTGKIAGRSLWGPGKAAAVTAFAEQHEIDLAASHAYANGDEDVDFLSLVGHPHPVNPAKGLAREAEQRGWPVLRLEGGPGRFDPIPRIRTAGIYASFFASVGTGFTLGFINRDRRMGIDLSTTLFGQLGAAAGNVKIKIQGAEHLWAHRPAVFLFNHQSSVMDMVVGARLIERDFTFVAKKEISKMPLFGQIFNMADVIWVDRSSTVRAVEAMQPAIDKLQSGLSVIIAPEGTRSVTPTVGRFKKGAFRMAMAAGVPVVPVVLRNAGELMWRDSQIAKSGTVDVVVHPPVYPAEWSVGELSKRIAEVRELYVQTLEDWPTGDLVEEVF